MKNRWRYVMDSRYAGKSGPGTWFVRIIRQIRKGEDRIIFESVDCDFDETERQSMIAWANLICLQMNALENRMEGYNQDPNPKVLNRGFSIQGEDFKRDEFQSQVSIIRNDATIFFQSVHPSGIPEERRLPYLERVSNAASVVIKFLNSRKRLSVLIRHLATENVCEECRELYVRLDELTQQSEL